MSVIMGSMLMLIIMAWLFMPTVIQAQTPASSTSQSFFDPYIGEWWYSTLKDSLVNWMRAQDSIWAEKSPLFLGKTIEVHGRVLQKVRCKEGDTLKVGDVAVWDTTAIAIADTAATKTARLENDLSAEGGYYQIYVYALTGSSSDDSLWIYGLDADGAAQTEIIVVADGDTEVKTESAYWWSEIDSIKDSQSSAAWTTYQVIGIPVFGVRGSDGSSGDFAGIVSGYYASGTWTEYILDNEEGYICIYGVHPARCDGASTYIFPGDRLMPKAGADLTPWTPPTVATTFTQDSLSTLAAYVDIALPIDSLLVKGHGTSTVSGVYHYAARAMEMSTADNTLIYVYVLP